MAKARNSKCSCGSGKKYKLCHGRREPQERRSRATFGLAIAVLVAVALVTLYATVSRGGEGGGDGRVWSAEHGHWHNAAGGELGSAPPATGGPGPGKVWSPEHNHYH